MAEWVTERMKDKQVYYRDADPILAKNRIRGSVPQTKGDFKEFIEWIC